MLLLVLFIGFMPSCRCIYYTDNTQSIFYTAICNSASLRQTQNTLHNSSLIFYAWLQNIKSMVTRAHTGKQVHSTRILYFHFFVIWLQWGSLNDLKHMKGNRSWGYLTGSLLAAYDQTVNLAETDTFSSCFWKNKTTQAFIADSKSCFKMWLMNCLTRSTLTTYETAQYEGCVLPLTANLLAELADIVTTQPHPKTGPNT